MAYNKSKYVEAAQKLLNQGKVPQAIAEYQHILKYEPKDQVTLMTIGELYIRQGETFQAIEYFERLAQIFVGDGFLTKAIAVYKRIAKLAPEEIKPLERLADLYVQQGVMSEARPLFLQLAEIHLKHNRQAEAVGLLKKLLLAEPDNLRIQIRLADLYQAMGKSADAIEAYVAAAQRALARGDHAESEKQAEKALKLDAKNAAALTVKARSASSQGRYAEASEFLKNLPGLERGGEQSEFLLDLYLKDSNWEAASNLAMQAFEGDEKNFGLAQKVAEALLESAQTERALALVSQLRIPMLDAGEQDAVARMLNDLATKMPGRLEPLEWLVDTYGRTSDSFRMPDALANLGDALVEAGQPQRAKEIFEQLVDRQPESEAAKRKLNSVLRKLGLLTGEEEPEPIQETLQAEIPQPEAPKLPSAMASEEEEQMAAEPPAAPAETPLDEETQKFISQSLTDVDLFASYGLTQKAIGLLEAILRRAPNHTPTLEKLLDFVLGAGDDRRTAELAAQLERIHGAHGDAAAEDRFAELRRRFQRAAGLTDEELGITAAKTAAPPTPLPAAAAPSESVAPPPRSAEARAHEVDLSDEWASLLNANAAAPQKVAPPPPPPPAAAAKALDVAEFEIPIAAPEEEAPAPAPASAAPPIAGSAPSVPAEQEIAFELVEEQTAAAPPPAVTPQAPIAAKGPAEEVADDQEFELVLTPEGEEDSPPETAKPANLASPKALESDQFLAELASEIDAMGLEPLSPTPSREAAPAAPQPVAPQLVAISPSNASTAVPAAPLEDSGEHQPLKEVFDDFRAEFGEMGAEDEDLETHYNLGIAFREMGLLEEAISEFQKVAKANENGKPFRYAMQCCTLLGLAFMDKGQPSIAAIWYERALRTPGVDSESIMALRYDLGVAQESANDLDAALKSFSQVYAMNIDYRDVADRIAALQKTTR